jgi:tRNA dimethylallyltransferase
LEKYPNGCLGLQTLGYPEIKKVLNDELGLEEAVEQITRATRRLAKRQLTFFRHQFPVHWVSASNEKFLFKDALEYLKDS